MAYNRLIHARGENRGVINRNLQGVWIFGEIRLPEIDKQIRVTRMEV